MKEKETKQWIPLYVDKWLFGSTRIELEPDERGVFIDLMALAAKDNGYIRANEDVAYLPSQIAGLLNISIELLNRTLEKCKKFGKIKQFENGILYITKWDYYKLSERHKRRFQYKKIENSDIMTENSDIMTENSDIMTENSDIMTIEKEKKEKEDIEKENKEKESNSNSNKNKEKESKEKELNNQCQIILDYFNQVCNKRLSMNEIRRKIILNRLKEGKTVEQLKQAILNFSKDDWEDRHKYCDMVYAIGIRNKIDNFEKWYNWKPKPKQKIVGYDYERYGNDKYSHLEYVVDMDKDEIIKTPEGGNNGA